jgi:predicted transcriptional regulator
MSDNPYIDITEIPIDEKDLVSLFDRLSESDRFILAKYYVQDVSQKEIAKLMGMTQGAVSSRLNRIKQRVQFLIQVSRYDMTKTEDSLKQIFLPLTVEVLKSMIKTTCQTETAKIINESLGLSGKNQLNQIKVRHIFEKSLKKLYGQEQYKNEYELLRLIKDNLYKLYNLPPHKNRRFTMNDGDPVIEEWKSP